MARHSRVSRAGRGDSRCPRRRRCCRNPARPDAGHGQDDRSQGEGADLARAYLRASCLGARRCSAVRARPETRGDRRMTGGVFDIVVVGLSLSSSWGNGHATTWRALIRGLDKLGRRVLFLERDVPWYAEHRDLANPDYCRLAFYESLGELKSRYGEPIRNAGAIIVGSYVPEGTAVIDFVLSQSRGQVGFYDIDTPVTVATL